VNKERSMSSLTKVSFDLLGAKGRSNASLIEALTVTEVFSPTGDKIATEFGCFELKLPKGIYRARVKQFGQVKDTLFPITGKGSTTISLKASDKYSISSVGEPNQTGMLYQSYLSKKETKDSINSDVTSDPYLSIFIQVKASKEADSGSLYDFGNKLNLLDGFTLMREGHSDVYVFGDEDVEINRKEGFCRLRARISPGFYRLMFITGNQLMDWLPIHVSSGFDCNLSMIWNDKFVLASATIFFPRSGMHEENESRTYSAINIDAITQTMASGTRNKAATSKLVHYLLNEKFVDPMLGLLGLHLVFLGKHAEYSNVDNIIRNLKYLMPGSPDVEALHYIAVERELSAPPVEGWRFEAIPMLRIGALAFKRAINNPDIEVDISDSLLKTAGDFFIRMQNYSVWALSQFSLSQLASNTPLREQKYSFTNSLTKPRMVRGDNSILNLTAWPIRFKLDEVAEDTPRWINEALHSRIKKAGGELPPQKLKELVRQFADEFDLLVPTVESLAKVHLVDGAL